MWIDSKGNHKKFDEIIDQIDLECEVFVGSDSQLNSDSWICASIICLYWPGRGGKFFVSRDRKSRGTYSCLEDRLLSEVHSSIDVAEQIRKTRPNLKIHVHADVASSPKNKSNKVARLVESYVSGMGFAVKIKPEAWAAAAIADRFTR